MEGSPFGTDNPSCNFSEGLVFLTLMMDG